MEESEGREVKLRWWWRKTRKIGMKKGRKGEGIVRIEMQMHTVARVIYEGQTCPYAIGTRRKRLRKQTR